MSQRLPGAPEQRVLLALYHKGPLTRTQLGNLEAMSMSSGSILHSLLDKALIFAKEGTSQPAYDLTDAGHDLCEVCVRHDLMVETNYAPNVLTQQVARRTRVLEGEFREVCDHAAEVAAVAPRAPPAAALEPEPVPVQKTPAPETAPSPPVAQPTVVPAKLPTVAKTARIPIPPPRIYSAPVPRK